MNTLKISVYASVALVATVAPVLAQSVDISKGRERAAVCMACHGQDGSATASPEVPRLAGQNRDYLIKALTAYRIGLTRTDETMTAMAKPLTDADIVNIAAFFSGLPTRR